MQDAKDGRGTDEVSGLAKTPVEAAEECPEPADRNHAHRSNELDGSHRHLSNEAKRTFEEFDGEDKLSPDDLKHHHEGNPHRPEEIAHGPETVGDCIPKVVNAGRIAASHVEVIRDSESDGKRRVYSDESGEETSSVDDM